MHKEASLLEWSGWQGCIQNGPVSSRRMVEIHFVTVGSFGKVQTEYCYHNPAGTLHWQGLHTKWGFGFHCFNVIARAHIVFCLWKSNHLARFCMDFVMSWEEWNDSNANDAVLQHGCWKGCLTYDFSHNASPYFITYPAQILRWHVSLVKLGEVPHHVSTKAIVYHLGKSCVI